ncbi:glycosyltransferase family 4 protein [Actinoplanes sp. NBRC 103695]|uniref:glycosyltransferase family 4 protein n=1 Tax=Actinoplanes sp. NBRC 103695 TaxID=3032202 RepID=UPI0024A1408A|nr:glycosyltransferase family 4 protein [Actinoplanes sp. NBRC 103695]GLZ01389.1 glycosyltransferase WbuB [Actinoplanes sp. NBRC 103695]
MRIVYIHQYFRTPEMSGGTRSFEFARRLVARGHEVQVVSADIDGDGESSQKWRESSSAGIRIHWASIPYNNKMSYRDRIKSFAGFAAAACARASKIPQDLVFATSTPLTVAIPGIYSARRNGVPFVLEVRDLWPEVPIALGALKSAPAKAAARRLERWAYRRSAHVVALSPKMAENVEKLAPGKSTTVIQNGCDVDLFCDAEVLGKQLRAATAWLGDRPLLLYAGTLGLVNGVSFLVRMAEHLVGIDPEIRLAVVGGGREESELKKLAQELGVLNRNLFFVAPMPKNQVVAYFGACDLSFSVVQDMPILAGDSANKVFDAWAAGRPVAINHGGWVADIISRTGAGVILPNGDPIGAAKVVASFVADSRRMAEARAAAGLLAQGDLSRDALFSKFEAVLARVSGQSNSG